MTKYVDGFVLPVPKRNLDAYREMAQKAGEIWREHGALEFRECVGDDLNVEGMTPFGSVIKIEPDETLMFSWIVYASREERDRINALVMKDPRLTSMESMPFDVKRMLCGGFKVLVEL
jgi:uncharacterized protein YbaA (DUF1428 family)